MLWINITRPQYERKTGQYASNVTQGEWNFLESRLPNSFLHYQAFIPSGAGALPGEASVEPRFLILAAAGNLRRSQINKKPPGTSKKYRSE